MNKFFNSKVSWNEFGSITTIEPRHDKNKNKDDFEITESFIEPGWVVSPSLLCLLEK